MGLRTPRLLLREWRDSDLDAFAAMAADPEVMRYLLPLEGRAASDVLAARIRAHLAEHRFGFWAVELSDIAPFIGMVGLSVVGFESHFTPAVEVGWRLARSHWARGYATEAAAAALDHGFRQLGFREVVAFTAPANHRSRRVMERLHMTCSEHDDFDHPRVPEGHPLRRHVLYRIRREDWG
ncbi:MAG TPA: GNAT family N-acetyltransferase [Stellaceae bacterium]|nr:GNAT family N-acetyltransferase [Stellaceae bacterium]